jgi:hypothetical protein
MDTKNHFIPEKRLWWLLPCIQFTDHEPASNSFLPPLPPTPAPRPRRKLDGIFHYINIKILDKWKLWHLSLHIWKQYLQHASEGDSIQKLTAIASYLFVFQNVAGSSDIRFYKRLSGYNLSCPKPNLLQAIICLWVRAPLASKEPPLCVWKVIKGEENSLGHPKYSYNSKDLCSVAFSQVQ